MSGYSASTVMFDPERVKRAFAWRQLPLTVLRPAPPKPFPSSDEEDALFFQGRDWRALTWDDWNGYFRGLLFFTAEALAYYMPSVMLLSEEEHQEKMLAVKSLLISLQSGVNCIGGDSQTAQNSLRLTKEECDALAGWLMHLCSLPRYERGKDRERIDAILTAMRAPLHRGRIDERSKSRG